MAERSAPEPPRDRDVVARHLGLAWQSFTPEPSLQDRVRARLTSSAAATMGAIGAGAALKVRPEGTWASLTASSKLGTALVGAGLLGLGLLSGYQIRDAQQERAPAPLVTPSTSSAAVPAPPASPDVIVAPSVTAPPIEAPPTPVLRAARPGQQRPRAPVLEAPSSAPAAPATTTANEELALLRRAERAVRSDNSALALALIAELEARHPRSSLLEERRAVELLAYCSAGATDAVTRAQRFLREHPQSVHAGRIAEQCAAGGELSSSGR